MFDPTKPVQTRDGCKARIICVDRQGTKPVVALVENATIEKLFVYEENGQFSLLRFDDSDLVNVPVKHSTWQTVAEKTSWLFGHFSSKAVAKDAEHSSVKAIGYVRRDYEDGVYVGCEFEKVS